MISRKAAGPHTNRLLGLLPPKDYQRLRPHLHRIPLEYRQSLYRANKHIEFVYFIETGVGSLVNTMKSRHARPVPAESEIDTHAVARGSPHSDRPI